APAELDRLAAQSTDGDAAMAFTAGAFSLRMLPHIAAMTPTSFEREAILQTERTAVARTGSRRSQSAAGGESVGAEVSCVLNISKGTAGREIVMAEMRAAGGGKKGLAEMMLRAQEQTGVEVGFGKIGKDRSLIFGD